MSALIHHIKRTSLTSRPMQPRVESRWSWRPDPRPFLRRERTPLGTGSGVFDAALGTGSGVCDAALGTGSGLCYAKRCRQPVVAGVGPGAAVSPPSFSALRAQRPRASAVPRWTCRPPGAVGTGARRGSTTRGACDATSEFPRSLETLHAYLLAAPRPPGSAVLLVSQCHLALSQARHGHLPCRWARWLPPALLWKRIARRVAGTAISGPRSCS